MYDLLKWLSIHNEAIVLRIQNPSWRRGQALFNALESIDRELADQIRGTDADPFYVDSREQAFAQAVTGYEPGEPIVHMCQVCQKRPRMSQVDDGGVGGMICQVCYYDL